MADAESSSDLMRTFATLLFGMEMYHFVTHCFVLFRIRLLPRKDLVKVRYYFLVDTLTVFFTCFVCTGKLRWLATLQMMQHFFFFFTWDVHHYTKRVINWSSLDWQSSEYSKSWTWDVALGTAFDAVVHLVNMYILYDYLTVNALLISIALVITFVAAIPMNPKFAWSNPSNIPGWVQKRIKPVINPWA